MEESMKSAAATKFWDFIANFYARQKVGDQDAYQFKLDATEKLLNKESAVFEFGCGTGSTALYHAPKVRKIVAIDASQEMIRIAREKQKNANAANVEFGVFDIQNYQNASEKFDVVLGLNILHLVPNWQQTIAKVHDLLKPGGYFLSSTACIGQSFFLKALIPLGALGLLPKLQFIKANELDRVLRDSGFEVLDSLAPGKDKNVQFVTAQKLSQ